MAAVAPDAQELRLEMRIPRIASRMICARISTMPRVVPGEFDTVDCCWTRADIYF